MDKSEGVRSKQPLEMDRGRLDQKRCQELSREIHAAML
jgi:hypothetical protein